MKFRIFTLVVALFFIGCNEEVSKENIVGLWYLEQVQTNQDIQNEQEYRSAVQQLIKTTTIEFLADNSFKGTIWGDTSFGYWWLKGDSLYVEDQSNKQQFSVLIKSLKDKKLILQETMDSVVEVMTFVK